MPKAAVPGFLGNDFSSASPGLRFGMYLEIWGVNSRSGQLLWTTHDVKYRDAGTNRQEREFKDDNKRAALDKATELDAGSKTIMNALVNRQEQICSTFSEAHCLTLIAESISPFTTGLGNEHPLENGFSFLNPYGLPYLPGSGVKGVLRQAARELESGDWGDRHDWKESAIEALFGRGSDDHDTDHQRGALSFWDVIPQIRGNRLMVEIMTPHQGHYYQGEEPPHESGQPNPISFLTVPPGSGFSFHVVCDPALLHRHAPDLVEGERWKHLLRAAFDHAFEWLGFGAKTAVGYGAMRRLSDEEIAAARNAEEQDKLKCEWVDETIERLKAEHRMRKESDVLRSKILANAWVVLDDAELKERALVDIRGRWRNEGWWDDPPGKAAKRAKAIYEDGS